ncbi:MAG TPA: hypothetical protein VLM40_22085 [Gemmata sp.]|nr:hypothetical protein [Gemmata sp.]
MLTTLLLLAAGSAQPAEPKSDLPAFAAEAVKPGDKDSPVRKLQKERARERAAALARMRLVLANGMAPDNLLDEYVKAGATLAANLVELVEKPEDKAKCFEMRVDGLKEVEKRLDAMVKVGQEREYRLNLARAARLDAEIDLLKCRESFALDLPADAESLLKVSIEDMTALAAAIDKKDAAEKIRAAARKLKATTTKFDALTLSKESRAALEVKFKSELSSAALALLNAGRNNPEGFKIAEELLRK